MPIAAATAFPWLNLVWVMVAIAALLFAVAGIGRWLAATHPDPVVPVRPAAEVSSPNPDVTPEIEAAIAAAVHVVLGASAAVTSVSLQPAQPVSVENLMLTWSLEGRRQIYTSHKVR
ncbi:MAG TPA: hypothetical protein VIM71_04670 [Lacunisphaera sp.]